MPRLFVGNFDFDHRLAWGDGTLPQSVERIDAELPPVWTAIADEGDLVWTPAPIDEEVFERYAARGLPRLRPIRTVADLPVGTELVFWGENDWAMAFARRLGQKWTGGDPAIVRRVNSRRFKFDLERGFDVALPGAALAESTGQLVDAVQGIEGENGWVLKGEFGGSGREVRFGAGPVSPRDLAWADSRFRCGLAVTIEPRLDAVEEAGLHFQIARDASVELLGVTPLLSRPGGGYVASRFDNDPALLTVWSEAIEIGRRVAVAVADEGYFGPLGIDAMRYRDFEGAIRIRPLQDLNARYTMGRLALGLRRFPAFSGKPFRPADFRAAANA